MDRGGPQVVGPAMTSRKDAPCRPTPHQALRAATAGAHEALDRRFGAFDLGDREDYGRFLLAHAAAIEPVEQALDRAGMGGLIDDWTERRRSALIAADLAQLGLPLPPPLPFAPLKDDGAAWGAAYVVEGSRLGGSLLAGRVADDLPRAYLATPLPKGAWRKLLAKMDRALYPQAMREPAIAAALRVFALFDRAASLAAA